MFDSVLTVCFLLAVVVFLIYLCSILIRNIRKKEEEIKNLIWLIIFILIIAFCLYYIVLLGIYYTSLAYISGQAMGELERFFR